jgi:hypothetical protein
VNPKGERLAVMEIMLSHLSLNDFARLVVAHDEVRAIAHDDEGADDGEPSPESVADTEPVPSLSTLRIPRIA